MWGSLYLYEAIVAFRLLNSGVGGEGRGRNRFCVFFMPSLDS